MILFPLVQVQMESMGMFRFGDQYHHLYAQSPPTLSDSLLSLPGYLATVFFFFFFFITCVNKAMETLLVTPSDCAALHTTGCLNNTSLFPSLTPHPSVLLSLARSLAHSLTLQPTRRDHS